MVVKLKKYIPILIILLLSIIVWCSGVYHYFNFDLIKEKQELIESFITSNITIAILIYSIIYITSVCLSIPVAAFLTITAGVLFDQLMGTIISVVSATLGATILFISAKMATSELKANSWINKMQDGFQNNAFFYLLTLRIIPIFPFFAVNIASAFFQITLRTFFFATFIGIIPGSFMYVALGVALKEAITKHGSSINIALDPKILVVLVGLGILSILPVIYKHFVQKA